MRILVTGGAGFIGSHVCEALLSAGHRVLSADNFNDFYDPRIKRLNLRQIRRHPRSENFQSAKADIRDAGRMRRLFGSFRPQAVIHLAAMAGVRPSIRNPILYSEVNIRGTQNLLELCVAYGVRRFVFASSSSVYGNNRKVPFSEADPVDRPVSPYAATKKAGELICHTYAHLHGLKVCCLRFFTVYGPRQRPDLAIHKFTRRLLEGKFLPFYGDGKSSRDYTYIEDTVGGVLGALRWTGGGGAAGRCGVFNLGESRTVTLSEMVRTLEACTGRRARLRRMKPQPGDVRRTWADIRRARRVLNYRPQTDFERGVGAFVRWYRGLSCRR